MEFWTFALLQLPSGHVWGRSQWLRGPESRRRRRVSVWGWGISRVAFHFQVWKHQLRPRTHQVRPFQVFAQAQQRQYWNLEKQTA